MKMIYSIRSQQILLLMAVLFVIARGAPVAQQQDKKEKTDISTDKIEENVQKSEKTDDLKAEDKQKNISVEASTPPPVTTPKILAKSPEVAEPPEANPSGNSGVDKRSAGLPALDTQMPDDAMTSENDDVAHDDVAMSPERSDVSNDEDFYLRAILSDPQLVRDIMDEETRLRFFQQVPPELDVDLTPSSMAWYLLVSGDIEGVTRMINALVAYGALSLNEARDYRMAVEEEYSQLSQTGLAYSDPLSQVQDYADGDVDYTAALPYPVGIPAFPLPVEYDTTNQIQPDAQDYLSSLIGQAEQQKSDEEYYYDGIMKELLDVISKENAENNAEQPSSPAAAESVQRIDEASQSQPQQTGPVESEKSQTSLVEELEGLFRGEEEVPKLVEDKEASPEKEMNVEEQLEQLLDNSKSTSSNQSTQNKQKQDNRTKSLPSLELQTQEKKDNGKNA